MKSYNEESIPLAKVLRKNMTPWERKLWYEFLRYYPIRFQRQKAIGNYIADFYCAKAKLVVELDGGGHYTPEQEKRDAERTSCLEKMNLQVLRICNLDIDRNFRGVCEYIDMFVKNSLPQSASLTAPSSEGAKKGICRKKTIYALGFFDGVHLGHQALLSACRELAAKNNCNAGVITFTNHPDSLVSGKTPALLNSMEDRRLLLLTGGMDYVAELPFDEELMRTHWAAFLRGLVEQGAAGFVCGSDFRFGADGIGTAEKLETFCKARELPYAIVPQQMIDDVRVSSTYIRRLLAEGEMEKATAFLGHPHLLSGEVIHGRGLGHTIGIPTANIALPEGVACPKLGVYACTATVDGKEHIAVTNVGTRPTVSGTHITVEPWLLDFEGDIYGKRLHLLFYAFLRPERKFDSLEELQEEIQRNATETRKFFKNYE